MKKIVGIFMISFIALFVTPANGKTKYDKFYDESRKREIPYKVYYPDELKERN